MANGAAVGGPSEAERGLPFRFLSSRDEEGYGWAEQMASCKLEKQWKKTVIVLYKVQGLESVEYQECRWKRGSQE